MLKSEVIKLINFDETKLKKLVLMRYTIELNKLTKSLYESQCLTFIQSIKSLPESFEKISFYYKLSDRKLTKLDYQKIIILVDDQPYYELILDDDLDFFFSISRLFHELEPYVESYEELTTEHLLPTVLERYK